MIIFILLASQTQSDVTLKVVVHSVVHSNKVIKAEVQIESQKERGSLNEEVQVTSEVLGGKFEFVEVKNGKCEHSNDKSQKKTIQVPGNETKSVFFYFLLQEEGEYELKVEASAENKMTSITEKLKTFEETVKKEKVFDLRSVKFGSYYLSPINENAYETRLNYTGQVFYETLKNVDKLL